MKIIMQFIEILRYNENVKVFSEINVSFVLQQLLNTERASARRTGKTLRFLTEENSSRI